MKKFSILIAIISIFTINIAYAGNCITQKRGVNISWYGKGGSLTLTKVRKLTKTFAVSVELNKKGNVVYSGSPSNGFKLPIPNGTQHVILNISAGQGEVCYSR